MKWKIMEKGAARSRAVCKGCYKYLSWGWAVTIYLVFFEHKIQPIVVSSISDTDGNEFHGCSHAI